MEPRVSSGSRLHVRVDVWAQGHRCSERGGRPRAVGHCWASCADEPVYICRPTETKDRLPLRDADPTAQHAAASSARRCRAVGPADGHRRPRPRRPPSRLAPRSSNGFPLCARRPWRTCARNSTAQPRSVVRRSASCRIAGAPITQRMPPDGYDGTRRGTSATLARHVYDDRRAASTLLGEAHRKLIRRDRAVASESATAGGRGGDDGSRAARSCRMTAASPPQSRTARRRTCRSRVGAVRFTNARVAESINLSQPARRARAVFGGRSVGRETGCWRRRQHRLEAASTAPPSFERIDWRDLLAERPARRVGGHRAPAT